jgi:hypothetical protein
MSRDFQCKSGIQSKENPQTERLCQLTRTTRRQEI